MVARCGGTVQPAAGVALEAAVLRLARTGSEKGIIPEVAAWSGLE